MNSSSTKANKKFECASTEKKSALPKKRVNRSFQFNLTFSLLSHGCGTRVHTHIQRQKCVVCTVSFSCITQYPEIIHLLSLFSAKSQQSKAQNTHTHPHPFLLFSAQIVNISVAFVLYTFSFIQSSVARLARSVNASAGAGVEKGYGGR